MLSVQAKGAHTWQSTLKNILGETLSHVFRTTRVRMSVWVVYNGEIWENLSQQWDTVHTGALNKP